MGKQKVVKTSEMSVEYGKLGAQIGFMVDDKQKAYGDSFGNADKIMKVLYPKGISLEQMPDALVVVRIIDKLFRIANRKDAFGESPYRDIAGYGLLGAKKEEQDK